MSQPGQKKRKKSWYKKQAFLNKRARSGHRLAAGQKGFIVTCNEHEKDAVREAYNILNEYAEKLYGPEETQSKLVNSSDDESEDEDMEKAIACEVKSLQAAVQSERRFQNCQTGAKNCIFIRTIVEDPVELAQAIFSDMQKTKVRKSRYALRLLPVVGTCRANMNCVETLAKEVLAPYFTDTKFEVTYTISFKARNNSGLGREMVISMLRKLITESFSSVLARYTPVCPHLTIMVEVMCGVCCIAVAKEFTLFRKYNLIEVVSERPATSNQNVSSKPEEKSDHDTSGIKEKNISMDQKQKTSDISTVKDENKSIEPVQGNTVDSFKDAVQNLNDGPSGEIIDKKYEVQGEEEKSAKPKGESNVGTFAVRLTELNMVGSSAVDSKKTNSGFVSNKIPENETPGESQSSTFS